jgi:aconitate hydratase
MGLSYPRYRAPERETPNPRMVTPPPPFGRRYLLEKGPNIKAMPALPGLSASLRAPVLLKMGDNISTDEILRAGAEALPFRSNIPEISKWSYYMIEPRFHTRALEAKSAFGGHVVVAGENYAQGSSREHAAIAPRYLGQQAVLARSYARLGWQNLVNFGILPLEFESRDDYDAIDPGDILSCQGVRERLAQGPALIVKNETKRRDIAVRHSLSPRQIQVMLSGGVIGYFRMKTRHGESADMESIPTGLEKH